MSYNKIIGAVEIGTSKVVVLVGEIIDGRSLNIIGMGQSTSMGVKKGEVVDFRSASDCTHAAIIAAEKNAGTTIEAVYLSQTGAHLQGFFDKGAVTVSSPDNVVSRPDISQAIENARRKVVPNGRVYIHHIQNDFFLDGRPVEDPFAMKGAHLEVGYWHVHGHERKVSDHIHVINGFGLEVEDMIISSIASGSMVVTEPEKQHGALALDIGCGTTDYVLYRNGRILRTGVLCVGGDHLTNDLSLGLRVSVKQAEKLKSEYGKAIIDREDKSDKIWLFGDLTIGDRPIPRLAIYQILNARIKELFEVIKRELGGALNPQELAGGVILTGGVSRLPHVASVASDVLGVTARVGENPAWVREDLREPEYSTVLGLLYYGLTAQRARYEEATRKGLMGKVAKMLNLG